MPLLVEQLIYTSFPKIGFKCLTSEQVPLRIKRAFSEQIVHEHWDTYDPPEPGFRGAYLHQLSLNQTLFGWLYNDGADDFGRSNIPYFICYYIAESLTPLLLDNIFTCLETGPVDKIDRRYPPHSIENLLIPDFCFYQAPMGGVAVASQIRQQSHNNLKQKQLINLFVVQETKTLMQAKQTSIQPQPIDYQPSTSSQTVLDLSSIPEPENNSLISFSATNSLEAILREFLAKPIGIEGVVLVSGDGHPIIPSLGLDDNSALILAGTMIYLAKSTEEELNWKQIENISLKGSQGHLILAACNSEMFLLVKAGKAVTGLLEAEIKRTLKKLNLAMEAQQNELQSAYYQPDNTIHSIDPQPLPELTSNSNRESIHNEEILEEFSEDLDISLDLDTEIDIRYRGRKTNR